MIKPTHTYTHILLIQEKAEVREVVTIQDRVRKNMRRTSLSGSVGRNPHVHARDTASMPGQGRSNMPLGN